MDNEAYIIQQLKGQVLLPLFYHADPATCAGVVGALYAAGIRSIEFTNRGARAVDNFKLLVAQRKHQWPGLLLGAGTIKDAADANRFIEAGADFLVSPFFDSGVCDAAYQNKTLWMPGCMTPTEIHRAEQAGCQLVKLFPGNTLTPGFVGAVKPLFPHVDFLVTGGVDNTVESIGAWVKAGACAVGMGSRLITDGMMQQQAFAQLTDAARAVLTIIKTVKA
jgi:2-dehydro-3-deoxyphosphogluconate aldolase / (4S)-4-hydroxy-2-oxoglutarate aldolase